MRIGLFTDTYRPSTNGIVTVIDITRKYLEELGHEVYIFAPAANFRKGEQDDPQVIRFPAVKGAFFDDYRTSIFFPPQMLNKIKKLNLDVVHFFTPGQLGLMAMYVGQKLGIITIAQHSTDVYEYIDHYPMAITGVFLLSSIMPLAFKLTTKQKQRLAKVLLVPKARSRKWGRSMIESAITMIYGACDATVVLSRKSVRQIQGWRGGTLVNLELIPTGVDCLDVGTDEEHAEFRKQWDIAPDDEVICYIGRLGSEKNLALLVEMIEIVTEKRPQARLLFVGDFEYGDELKQLAANSRVPDRITFTGMLPRESLGNIYAGCQIFAFPSTTDTQGLVLHEAAHAGLPIVIIDEEVTEVVRDGYNGLVSENNPHDFADKVLKLLQDAEFLQLASARSKELAQRYTEKGQTEALVDLYTRLGA